MDLDENDDEVWRGWTSDPVPELTAALPDRWWQMYPTAVHPEFAASLRREYRWCRNADGRCADRRHERWAELLSDGGPGDDPAA